MDNFTHSLTGYVLARAGLDRFSPRAAVLLVLAANAPDLDILFLTQGGLPYFEAHRGYSHSVLLLPFMALLTVVVTAGLFRQRLPWFKAWLICCLGVASHLLIDWTNNYGIRLALPVSSRWFHADLNSLYDVWILLALLFGLVWPLFSRLVSSEIGARSRTQRGAAAFALCFFFFFDCGRAFLHSQAVRQLESRLYDGEQPFKTAAFADPFSPLDWTGVVETERASLRVPVHSFSDLDPTAAIRYFKPDLTLAIETVKSRPEFAYMSYFSRFPVWSVALLDTGQEQGRRIELTDLRFGTPGAGAFHCIATLDASGHVRDSWFTYGSGRELGWEIGGQR
ncbi:MAG: metal-dependent hydrolase [Bryobacteraceae bacterium]